MPSVSIDLQMIYWHALFRCRKLYTPEFYQGRYLSVLSQLITLEAVRTKNAGDALNLHPYQVTKSILQHFFWRTSMLRNELLGDSFPNCYNLQRFMLFEQNKHIIFLWTPGHAGIRGNEPADEAARQATEARITDVPLLLNDAKAASKQRVFNAWQREWNSSNNYLKLFKPTITKWSLPPLTCREQAQVRPSLEYCSHVWGCAPKHTLKFLVSIQKRAVRLIVAPNPTKNPSQPGASKKRSRPFPVLEILALAWKTFE
nr:unnamed protein product [Callosobruchus analis]